MTFLQRRIWWSKILRMNRKILYILLGGVSAVFMGGCGILSEPSYTVTRNYDLESPPVLNTPGYDVMILPFASETAGRYKMVTRSGVELYQDEYNRWTQPPALLLTRYLRMALSDNENTQRKNLPVYEVSGTVLMFEADLKTYTAFLCVRYSILERRSGKVMCNGLLRYNIPMNKKDTLPVAFAHAMSEAANKFVNKLYSDMNGLQAGTGKK